MKIETLQQADSIQSNIRLLRSALKALEEGKRLSITFYDKAPINLSDSLLSDDHFTVLNNSAIDLINTRIDELTKEFNEL